MKQSSIIVQQRGRWKQPTRLEQDFALQEDALKSSGDEDAVLQGNTKKWPEGKLEKT